MAVPISPLGLPVVTWRQPGGVGMGLGGRWDEEVVMGE